MSGSSQRTEEHKAELLALVIETYIRTIESEATGYHVSSTESAEHEGSNRDSREMGVVFVLPSEPLEIYTRG